MKKGTIKGFVAGMAVMALIVSMVGTALATYAKKTIAVDYCDIKIVVDGKQINPVDVNGKTVEPFAYNGSTLLPVRAVASACGYNVEWNQETYTVTLTRVGYKTGDYVTLYQDIAVPSFDNVLNGGKYENVTYAAGSALYTYDESVLPSENILIDEYEKVMTDYGFYLAMSEADENSNMTYTFINTDTGMSVFSEQKERRLQILRSRRIRGRLTNGYRTRSVNRLPPE